MTIILSLLVGLYIGFKIAEIENKKYWEVDDIITKLDFLIDKNEKNKPRNTKKATKRTKDVSL